MRGFSVRILFLFSCFFVYFSANGLDLQEYSIVAAVENKKFKIIEKELKEISYYKDTLAEKLQYFHDSFNILDSSEDPLSRHEYMFEWTAGKIDLATHDEYGNIYIQYRSDTVSPYLKGIIFKFSPAKYPETDPTELTYSHLRCSSNGDGMTSTSNLEEGGWLVMYQSLGNCYYDSTLSIPLVEE